MKGYNKGKKKTHIITWLIGEAIFIFVIATAAIILYDMYINIDVEKYDDYAVEKPAKEVSSDSSENKTDDDGISEMLENVSRSVVRNIKDCFK